MPESATYVNTDVYIAPGQFYEFQASGTIKSGVWFTGPNGPAGWNTVNKDTKFPFHNGPYAYPYSLIGQIGYDPLFYIGTGLSRQKFVGFGSGAKHIHSERTTTVRTTARASFLAKSWLARTRRFHTTRFLRNGKSPRKCKLAERIRAKSQ